MKKFLLSLAAVAMASSAWAGSYKAVTSVSELTDGNFLIVCPSKNMAMAAQSGSYRANVSVKITDNVIDNVPTTAQICTIEPNGSNYYIKMGDKYLSWSSGNGCASSDSGYALSISIADNGNATIASVATTTRKFQYNARNPRFAFYESSQTAIQLFKEDNSNPNLLDPELSFSTPEIKINIGETFEAPDFINKYGLAVTWNSSNKDVATVDASTGAVTLIAAGETTITATSEETETYKAGKAEYTLIVIDPNAIIDILNPESTLKPGTYTSSESYTSELTGIVYKSQTYSNKGYQFNNEKAGSGIAVSNNSNGYTIKKITITPKSGLTESQANNGVKIYAGNTACSTGSTDGTEIGNPKGSEDIVIIPDADYSYFSIVHNGGVYIIAEIKIEWNAPKTNEKKDFDLTMVLKGAEENEDIESTLGDFNDEFHYYMPEGDQDFEFEFNLAEGLTHDMFNDMATWKITEESTSADVTDNMLLFEGTRANIFPSEAGTYRIYFDLGENEHYITAGSNNYFVHVYPHVDKHFVYDDLEINNCVDNSGVFKLSKFETTNNGTYDYYYKVVKSGAATLSAEEEGYTKYDHETGINLGDGTHTIEFTVEKNGVKSLKPKTFTISVSTGVETVGAEAGEAVYFDLQGRRVNGQPEQGLYIVRKGGKTSKVIL